MGRICSYQVVILISLHFSQGWDFLKGKERGCRSVPAEVARKWQVTSMHGGRGRGRPRKETRATGLVRRATLGRPCRKRAARGFSQSLTSSNKNVSGGVSISHRGAQKQICITLQSCLERLGVKENLRCLSNVYIPERGDLSPCIICNLTKKY